jgi:hypothetical protein
MYTSEIFNIACNIVSNCATNNKIISKGVTKYYVMHLTDILTGYIVFKIVILSLVNPYTI